MIKVAIVDDKLSNRKVIVDKLSRNPRFKISFLAEHGQDFLNQMNNMNKAMFPDIVLMDLEMPQVDGISAILTASSLYPTIKFVVLTIFDDDDKIFYAIKAGACGYILKEESGEHIADLLINLWESGAGPISPSVAYKILQLLKQPLSFDKSLKNENGFQLSDREQEILILLSQGLEYKEIAQQLYISPNTVKKHTINIYQKLHVNSKAQALRIAYTQGLI